MVKTPGAMLSDGTVTSWLQRRRRFFENGAASVGLRDVRKRQSDPEQRIAIPCDSVAHFCVDVAGLAAAGMTPVRFGCAWRERRIRRDHQPVVGMPEVDKEFVQGAGPYLGRAALTSGRCSASTARAPPAASDRLSAAARSSAGRASGRRPCCRRAAGG
jgi:hypothetical protein